MNFAIRKLWLYMAISAGLNLAIGNGAYGQQAGADAQAPRSAEEHNNVRAAAKWRRFDFTCEGEAKIVVMIHDSSAKVYYAEHLYLMRQTPAADGTRYSDGKVVWWSKGDTGFLQEEDTSIGEGQKIVKDCYRVAAQAEGPRYSTVNGTLTYLVRMALPPQAVVEVQLLDLTRGGTAAAPGALVTEEKFPLGSRQPPVAFTLKVDSAKIDPKHTYGISALILMLDQPRFVTKEPYRVLTQGNPAKADMVLLPARGEER